MRTLEFPITADANGVGSFTHPFCGLILDITAIPGAGFSANGDFTMVSTPKPGVTGRTLLTGTNIGTSLVNYPIQVNSKDATGAAISGTYEKPAVCGNLTFNVSGAGSGGVITFYVTVLDSDGYDGRRQQ